MKEKMNSLQVLLLKRLMSLDDTVNSQFLANSLGVSSRTVRNNLRELNELLKMNGASIESKTGYGYRLVIEDRPAFEKFVSALAIDPFNFSFNSLPEDRVHLIIRHLLCQNGYIRIESLESLLYMNRTSIKAYLNRGREILDRFGLQIVTKSHHGIRIAGSEHDLRMGLNWEYGPFQATSLKPDTPELYASIYQFDTLKAERISRIILSLQSQLGSFHLSSYSIGFLTRLIMISAIRNQQSRLLQYSEAQILYWANQNTYPASKQILNQCAAILKCSFTREDTVLVTIHLEGLRVLLQPCEVPDQVYLESRDLAVDIVQNLALKNNFCSINKDIQLTNDLACHLYGVSIRSHYHIRTSQFSNERFLDCSLMSKKLAMQTFYYLETQNKMKGDEEEIYRMAMVFHPFFGRLPLKFKKIRACCLSDVDKSVGKKIAERLQRNFSRYVESIDVLELYELKEKDLSGYEIMFTTYPKEALPHLPQDLTVWPAEIFFDEVFKQNVRARFVNGINHSVFPIRQYISRQNIYTGLKVRDDSECLNKISELLCAPGGKKEMLQDLQLCERMMPSHPKNNVLILSGIESHFSEIMIAIFILKRPIMWGSGVSKAQIILYWDRGRNEADAERFENEYVPHLLQSVMNNRKVINELVNEIHYERFISMIEEMHYEILATINNV